MILRHVFSKYDFYDTPCTIIKISKPHRDIYGLVRRGKVVKIALTSFIEQRPVRYRNYTGDPLLWL